ncbi:MAG: hypothetical protein H6707_03455 [Deltaproteobacteria bacterium]|nr:hypothetical protein [Deltaproteobacteria bacterium]
MSLRVLIQWLRRLLVVIAVTLIVLLTPLVLLIVAPPSDLLRRAALPIARKALNHPQLEIDSLWLRPLRGIELRGVVLGPPAGFKLPLFSVDRISLRYQLGRLPAGRLLIDELIVKNPRAYLEQNGQRLNWLAFLSNLPAGASDLPPPVKPPNKPPSPPSNFTVEIKRLAVDEIATYIQRNDQRLRIGGLRLASRGAFSQRAPDLTLELTFRPAGKERHNIALRTPDASAMLASDVRLKLRLLALSPPRVETRLHVGLATRSLKGILAPIDLRADFAAVTEKGDAHLETLDLTLNGRRIVQARGRATQIFSDPQLDLTLKRLYLPFDELSKYLALFVKDIAVEGSVALDNIRIRGPASAPQVAGQLSLRDISARIGPPKRPQLRLERLSANLQLAADTTPGRQPPAGRLLLDQAPLSAQGKLKIARLRTDAAAIDRLKLRIKAAATLRDNKPDDCAIDLGVDIDRLHAPGTPLRPLPVSITLRAQANLPSNTATLERFALRLQDQQLVAVQATHRPNKRHRARVDIGPLQLQQLSRWLRIPALAALGARGTLRTVFEADVDAATVERMTRSPIKPANLGGQLLRGQRAMLSQLRIEGENLSAIVGQERATISSAKISLAIEPSGTKLSGRLALPRLTLAGATLGPGTIDLALDSPNKKALRLTLTPNFAAIAQGENRIGDLRTQLRLEAPLGDLASFPPPELPLDLQLTLAAKRLRNADNRLAALRLSAQLTTRAPLRALLANKSTDLPHVKLRLDANIGKVTGPQLQIDDVAAQIALVPEQPGRYRLTERLSIAALKNGDNRVDRLTVETALALAGLPTRWPLPALKIDQLYAPQLQLAIRLPRIRAGGAPPFDNNALLFDAQLFKSGRLKLKQLAVQLPSRGLTINGWGQLEQLPLDGKLPGLDAQFDLAFTSPRTKNPNHARQLLADLRTAGKLALSVTLKKPVDSDWLSTKTRIIADAFHLWSRGTQIQRREDGNYLRIQQRLSLEDLNADIKLAQRVNLTTEQPQLALTDGAKWARRRQRSFRELAPYQRRQPSVAFGRLAIDERIAALTKGGQLINARQRGVVIDQLAADLSLSDGALALDRLRFGVAGGDIAGHFGLRLASLAPLDAEIDLGLQLTGIQPRALVAGNKAGKQSRLSALLDLRWALAEHLLDGRVDITQIALSDLDAFLLYLDPNGVDPGIKTTRAWLTGSLAGLFNPTIDAVSIWLDHSNLNMDINLSAALIGWYLQRQLKNARIRRLSIRPQLENAIGPLLGSTSTTKAKKP